jgi:methionine synthase II (cobalamin-independent)
MIAWTKLELLCFKEQTNHFALKSKIYVKALRTAYQELQSLKTFVAQIDQPNLEYNLSFEVRPCLFIHASSFFSAMH